jgi:putative SOS response-associated peptidase YedK
MCTRYAQLSIEEMCAVFSVVRGEGIQQLEINYDTRPTTPVPAVRMGADGAREIVRLPWMFHHAGGRAHPNAKGENLNRIPVFKDCFASRRCIVPARGYYEWRPVTPKFKQRYYFTRKDGLPIAFPGIYSADEKDMAIITMPPSSDIAEIHDRMPIFLERENWDAYLAPGPLSDLERKQLIVTPPAGILDVYPVDNKERGVELTKPLQAGPPAQTELF